MAAETIFKANCKMKIIIRQKGRDKAWWLFIAYNNEQRTIKAGTRETAERLAGAIKKKLIAGIELGWLLLDFILDEREEKKAETT